MTNTATNTLKRWLALGPAYVWLILFGFAPLLIMLAFSFLSDVPLGRREVTLTFENYARFFERTLYQRLTLASLLMALWTTVGCLLLGYPLAYGLARAVSGKWRGALFLLVIVPFWSNSLVRIYSWVAVLQNNGVLAQFFGAFGFQIDSLLFTYPTIIVGLVHAYLPYMALTIYIALDRIDPALIEAATSLGARPLRTFTRVILPLSMPGVISGIILVFIPAVGSFVEPRLLGGPQGLVLGTVIEDQFVDTFNWTLGAALSFIMLLIVLAMLALSLVATRVRARRTL